jgi:hypothetical protein
MEEVLRCYYTLLKFVDPWRFVIEEQVANNEKLMEVLQQNVVYSRQNLRGYMRDLFKIVVKDFDI